MTTRRPDCRDQHGVTLLELVITLTIVSFLALIAVQAFQLGSRSWERGEKRAEAEQRFRVVSAILAQQLASLHPARALVDGKPVLAFQGMSDRIFFYSAPDGQGPLPYSAMVRGQAYFVEPGKGLVVQESYPLVEGDVSLEPRGVLHVVEPAVTRVEFRYLSPPAQGETDPRWVEAWDPRAGSGETQTGAGNQSKPQAQQVRSGPGSPPPEARLPLAVEVTVVVQAEQGERQVGLILPIYVGRAL